MAGRRDTGRLPGAILLTAAALLAACSSPPRKAPPVVDRTVSRSPASLPGASSAPGGTAAPGTAPGGVGEGVAVATPLGLPELPKPQLPLSEFAGHPGYYSVRPGDTLIRIGLEHGQNWRDIARWSQLADANRLEVGQVLRVVPPVVTAAAPAPAAPGGVAPPTRPAASGAGASPPAPSSPPAAPVGTAAASAAAAPPASGPAPAAAGATSAGPLPGDEQMAWSWPAAGPVLAGFDEARNKGLALGGKAGDPVLAAADGRVVYAGAGLRGYGNLVILKHNGTYLSAYGHNQTVLVKEDQTVRKGQRIAEMGSSDAERVQLHFEIRRLGKPVDPAGLLPVR